jgi:hypothetical protein
MSTTTDITRAAFDKLTDFSYDPQPDILWPGLQTKPPATGLWLEPELFPDEPEDIAWDDESCVETRGFFQILVHYRPGEGSRNPVLLADALIRHFQKGEALGPVRIVERAWQGTPVDSSDELFIPVTIPYMGLT